MTIETKITNGRLSVTVNENKVTIAKAAEMAIDAHMKNEEVKLVNENGDYGFLPENFTILGLYNTKFAIQQFGKGKPCKGATVLNGETMEVFKAEAATVEVDPEDYAINPEAQDVETVIGDELKSLEAECESRDEKAMKLHFAVNCCFHFYLNNLKKVLFDNFINPLFNEGKTLNPEVDRLYKKFTAAAQYTDYDKFIPTFQYCKNVIDNGISPQAQEAADIIFNGIVSDFGDKILARELTLIIDEFGIDHKLLTQSDNCYFDPAVFNTEIEQANQSTTETERNEILSTPLVTEEDDYKVEIVTTTFNNDKLLHVRDILTPIANQAQVELGDLTLGTADKLSKSFSVNIEVKGSTNAIENFKTLLNGRHPEPPTNSKKFIKAALDNDAERMQAPTGNFTDKLFTLKAAQADAKKIFDVKEAEAAQARTKWLDSNNALEHFFSVKADELADKLLPLKPDVIEVKTQKGFTPFIATESLSIGYDRDKFIIHGDCSEQRYFFLAEYDTPAQVEAAINNLKATIENGGDKFTFPDNRHLPTVNHAHKVDTPHAFEIGKEYQFTLDACGNFAELIYKCVDRNSRYVRLAGFDISKDKFTVDCGNDLCLHSDDKGEYVIIGAVDTCNLKLYAATATDRQATLDDVDLDDAHQFWSLNELLASDISELNDQIDEAEQLLDEARDKGDDYEVRRLQNQIDEWADQADALAAELQRKEVIA